MESLRKKTVRRHSIQSLRGQDLTTAQRNVRAASYVLQQEIGDGATLFHLDDGTPYIRLSDGEILQLDKRNEVFAAHLEDMYGLNIHDPMAKFVFESIRSKAIREGSRVELRRFARFDLATRILYVSKYDGEMWKLDGTTIESLPNGDDNVFFADDDGGRPCADPVIGENGVLFDALTNLSFSTDTASHMTPEVQRKILTAWLFALAFPDLQPTKPMLIVEGVPGSGKSSAVQLIQLALLGIKKPLILRRNQEDDFGVLLLRAPIACIDNLDSYVEWIPDAVCAYATSGQWTKRKLYTNDAESIIKPHAFIAVASKNPASFRRPDTAERTLVIRLGRREKFVRQGQLEASLLTRRPEILGEYIYYLNRIVDVIRSGVLDEVHDERLRMADFAAFLRVIAIVFEWTDEEVDQIISAIEEETSALIDENDCLVEVLTRWLSSRHAKTGKLQNVGRSIGLNELFSELGAAASMWKIDGFYENPKILREKLKSAHLTRKFKIEFHRDIKQYQLWRIDQPQLSLVPDETPPKTVDDFTEAVVAGLPKVADGDDDSGVGGR